MSAVIPALCPGLGFGKRRRTAVLPDIPRRICGTLDPGDKPRDDNAVRAHGGHAVVSRFCACLGLAWRIATLCTEKRASAAKGGTAHHAALRAARPDGRAAHRSHRGGDLGDHRHGAVRGAGGICARGDERGPASVRGRVPAQPVCRGAAAAAVGVAGPRPSPVAADRALRVARRHLVPVDAGLVLCHLAHSHRRGDRHQLPGAAVRHARRHLAARRAGAHAALGGADRRLRRRDDHPAARRQPARDRARSAPCCRPWRRA